MSTQTYRPPATTSKNHVAGTAATPTTPGIAATRRRPLHRGRDPDQPGLDLPVGVPRQGVRPRPRHQERAAWIHGGNPTLGFLKMGAEGPFADFYHSIAGATWTNWLFMLGLAGIGIALLARGRDADHRRRRRPDARA